MKKLLTILLIAFAGTAFAGGQIKEVCKDKVNVKTGKTYQECKKIKVHKKLKGTQVPPTKK